MKVKVKSAIEGPVKEVFPFPELTEHVIQEDCGNLLMPPLPLL